MTAKGTFVHEGNAIDHTPSSAVAAGAVVVVGTLVGIATRPIAANARGSLEVEGVFDVAKASGGISAGAKVYWDADGNPVSGDAGSGAATTTATDNTLFGKAIAAAAIGDATVRVKLIQLA